MSLPVQKQDQAYENKLWMLSEFAKRFFVVLGLTLQSKKHGDNCESGETQVQLS